MRIFAFAAAVAALIAAPAFAAPWKLDKSHAHVTFSVEHLGFSITRGQFRDFDAVIDFDPENMETSSISVTINTDSVDTNWGARDNHIKGPDFLDVANHPTISFASKSVRLTGDNTAEVTGDVTIKGVTHEETFTATMLRLGASPFNPSQEIAGFSVEGEIDRTKYGVAFGAPAIGAVIPLKVDMEISPQ